METCGKENISDCPTLRREGAVSTNRKKKPAGFNLRKSIAWNPAFFTEEGVLDNLELTTLSGSQMKPNRSPGSGVGGATVSPLCRFGRSGSTSLLKEVAENSRAKLPVRRTENKGRQLFSPAKTSDQDERRELAGTHDKRSAKSIQKRIPRPSAGNAQKNVPNSSATSQMFRTPKKSQPPIPMVLRSTPSSTNMSKPNRRLPPVKTEHPRRAEGLQLKSKVKPTSLTKPSVDVAPAVTAIHEEASASRKCESFSIYSQNRPSGSYGVPASTFAKPSALRMPSPSVGFFAQGKASVTHGDTAQGNAKSYFTGNTSSLVKPPRYKQPEDLKGRLFQDHLSNGYTAQGHAKSCFTGNTSSLVKPPRYKQPEDLKSRLSLTKQLPTNSPAASKLLVHPVTNESTLDTLASSSPGLEHANVCSARVSLPRGVITDLAKSGNTDNQQARKVGCFSAGSGATTQLLHPEKNDGSRNVFSVPSAYSDASHVEERDIINRIEPIEDPHSLKAICSSTIEPVEDSCSHKAICSSTLRSNMPPSCMSSQVCTLDDLNCQSKSDDCASVATDLENSLVGETTITVSLSEGNNCIPGPDFLRDFDSSNQENTAECSTLMEPVKSMIYADRVPQCGVSIDIKPALAESTSELYGSLCYEVQPTSSEEPNTDDQMELDPDNSLIAEEAQLLHVGCECDHDYRSTECPSVEQAEPMPCVDQETQAVDLSDLKAVMTDSKTEPDDSLAVERQPVLLEDPNIEDDMELDTSRSSALEDASPIEKNKAVNKPGTNTILKDHLKHLVPFTEEWLAAMEACGEEVLEQKTGAVQNSPTDKTAPEPSPWSPVKRKAQDVGPFDCTKYSKSVRTSDTP